MPIALLISVVPWTNHTRAFQSSKPEAGDSPMSSFPLGIYSPLLAYSSPIYLPSISQLRRRERSIATVEGMEEQVELVGKAFVDHYYHVFDSDRSSLASLYQPSSLLTFEGQQISGVEDISAKLNQLPFDQCRHVISTIDSQSSPSTGGIVVFASGSIHLAEEEHHLRFSQMFHLIPTLQGSFYVQNDIFRLNYG